MTDIRKQLLAAFDAEHREHLQAIRAALDHADRGEIDLTDVFRRAHSLKGAARAVDLPAVEEVAHQLEALFSQVLEGQQSLDAPTVATVRQNLDLIEDLVADMSKPPEPKPAGRPPCRLRRPHPANRNLRLRKPMRPDSGAGSYLRVAAEQMEELSDSMHRLLTELQADEGIDDTLRQIEQEIRGLRRGWDQLYAQVNALGSAARQESNAAAIRSGGSFAPRLRDFDQGLKTLFRRLSALSRDRRQSRWSIEQAASQVRDNIDRVSLVSAETVFGGFGHMVREIARKAGRDVHVRSIGLDIQVDRQVLQALKDPVMHLLRNAVSHGAETPEERVARGKPERAEVTLELASRGGRLAISIRDDGRGPDLRADRGRWRSSAACSCRAAPDRSAADDGSAARPRLRAGVLDRSRGRPALRARHGAFRRGGGRAQAPGLRSAAAALSCRHRGSAERALHGGPAAAAAARGRGRGCSACRPMRSSGCCGCGPTGWKAWKDARPHGSRSGDKTLSSQWSPSRP